MTASQEIRQCRRCYRLFEAGGGKSTQCPACNPPSPSRRTRIRRSQANRLNASRTVSISSITQPLNRLRRRARHLFAAGISLAIFSWIACQHETLRRVELAMPLFWLAVSLFFAMFLSDTRESVLMQQRDPFRFLFGSTETLVLRILLVSIILLTILVCSLLLIVIVGKDVYISERCLSFFVCRPRFGW